MHVNSNMFLGIKGAEKMLEERGQQVWYVSTGPENVTNKHFLESVRPR